LTRIIGASDWAAAYSRPENTWGGIEDVMVHLTTYSFQAPDFYERHGYERFGELDDYPGDQSLVFLRKRL